MVGFGDCGGHQERSGDRAGLVESGMQSESPAMADFAGGFGEEHVAGGTAEGFAGPLRDHQKRGHAPIAGEGQRGDHDDVEGVSGNGDGPIGARTVGQFAGEVSQAGGDHFAKAGDQPDFAWRWRRDP